MTFETHDAEIRALESRMQDLNSQAESLKRQIDEKNSARNRLLKDISLVERLIIDAKTRGTMVGDPKLPRKSINVQRAWAAMKYAFEKSEDGKPLTNKMLRDAVRKIAPEIKDGTFRSYIHRFKNEKRIGKNHQGYWFMINSDVVNKASE